MHSDNGCIYSCDARMQHADGIPLLFHIRHTLARNLTVFCHPRTTSGTFADLLVNLQA
jgi:hypothetical protein